MDLFTAAHELYGKHPSEFMDTRKRLVTESREAGDAALAKEIGALRRPTLSAWAVNQLSREAAEELARLLEVGDDLRAAWAEGSSIGGLEQQRNELVTLLSRTAQRLATDAGQPLREPAVREVEETLQAVAVDPEVAEEVRQGRLTQPRSHAGFVPAGFTGQPAPALRTQPAPKKKPKASKADEDKRKAEEARIAREKAEEAEQALAEWKAEAAAAQDELDTITAEADRIQRELEEVLGRKATAERRARLAQREVNRSTRTAEDARRRASG